MRERRAILSAVPVSPQAFRVRSGHDVTQMIMQHTTLSRRLASAVFFAVLLVFGALSPVAAQAGSASGELPSRADVQSQLDALGKQKNHSAQDKLTTEDLSATLETLDKIERIKQETVQLRQQVLQAPEKMRQATDNLSALQNQDSDEVVRQTLKNLSLRQLESRVTSVLDDLQTAQNDLATFNSQLVSLQTQPERVQNAMYNASQQLQQIRNRLNGTALAKRRCARLSRRSCSRSRRC